MAYTDIEVGIIVGLITAQLQQEKQITFTIGYDSDGELLKLAQQLKHEFDDCPEKFFGNRTEDYGYFSSFVTARLLQMEEELTNQ